MRTRIRTFLLSAAFAIAAVSQASAAWDSDCLASQVDQHSMVSIVESVPPEAVPSTASIAAVAVDEPAGEVMAPAAADVVIALPEDIDLQVTMEMAALAQPAFEAQEAAGAKAPIAEVETTGSLSASLSIPQVAVDEAISPDIPAAE